MDIKNYQDNAQKQILNQRIIRTNMNIMIPIKIITSEAIYIYVCLYFFRNHISKNTDR